MPHQLPGCTGRAEELDHIVPISKGGALLELSNIRAACTWCNQTRRYKALGQREPRRPLRQW